MRTGFFQKNLTDRLVEKPGDALILYKNEWHVKYRSAAIVNGVSGNVSNAVAIYPNPAYTDFQISNFNFQKDDEIILRNALGKISFTKKIQSPTSNLPINTGQVKLQTSNFKLFKRHLLFRTKNQRSFE